MPDRYVAPENLRYPGTPWGHLPAPPHEMELIEGHPLAPNVFVCSTGADEMLDLASPIQPSKTLQGIYWKHEGNGVGNNVSRTTTPKFWYDNNDPRFQVGTGDFAFSWWMKAEYSAWSWCIDFNGPPNRVLFGKSNVANKMYITVGSSGVQYSNALLIDEWTHWTATRIDGVVYIYANGSYDSQFSATTDLTVNAQKTFLQQYNRVGTWPWQGPVGPIAHWARGLDPAEVAELNDNPFPFVRIRGEHLVMAGAGTSVAVDAGPIAGAGSLSGAHVISVGQDNSTLAAAAAVSADWARETYINASTLGGAGALAGDSVMSVGVDAQVTSATGALLADVVIAFYVSVDDATLASTAALQGTPVMSVAKDALAQALSSLHGNSVLSVSKSASVLPAAASLNGEVQISVGSFMSVMEMATSLEGQFAISVSHDADPLVANASLLGAHVIGVNVSGTLAGNSDILSQLVISVGQEAGALLGQGQLEGEVYILDPFTGNKGSVANATTELAAVAISIKLDAASATTQLGLASVSAELDASS